MKGYRTIVVIFVILLAGYIVAEVNRPRPIDWTISLRKDDKIPFGSYALYSELKQLFPSSTLETHREPAYNTVHGIAGNGSIYFAIANDLEFGKPDIDALLEYADAGNQVFIASGNISGKLLDTLGLAVTHTYFNPEGDSTSFNFTNPALRVARDYPGEDFMNSYFTDIRKKDSTVVLGIDREEHPNFVKISYGKGSFYVHCVPLCFTNYFMLTGNNAEYISKALSYLQPSAPAVFWDEYYKSGRAGASTPLRFFLSNEFLQWAIWIAVIGLLAYVLFEMKRRQRVIPVIDPPRNTSMDFVQTVASVYLAQKNNHTIASKKIQFWLDFVRRNYYLSATELNDLFIQQVSAKSGADRDLVDSIVKYAAFIQGSKHVDDSDLLRLNTYIDNFYNIAQKN